MVFIMAFSVPIGSVIHGTQQTLNEIYLRYCLSWTVKHKDRRNYLGVIKHFIGKTREFKRILKVTLLDNGQAWRFCFRPVAFYVFVSNTKK